MALTKAVKEGHVEGKAEKKIYFDETVDDFPDILIDKCFLCSILFTEKSFDVTF